MAMAESCGASGDVGESPLGLAEVEQAVDQQQRSTTARRDRERRQVPGPAEDAERKPSMMPAIGFRASSELPALGHDADRIDRPG